MRIGVDACCWSNRRGFGRFTRELLTALLEVDGRNEYLFFADRETAAESAWPAGAELIAAPTRVAPTRAASADGRRSARDLWALSREVLRRRVDLFFFPAVYSYFPVFNRAKVVVTIHDLIADRRPELVFPATRQKLFWKLKQNLALRQSDLILTVSEYSRRQILDYFRLPDSRVRAISEAARPAFTRRLRDGEAAHVLARYGLAPRDRFLLYVGGISPHKNLGTLVEALSRLRAEAGFADLRLLLVGDYAGDAFHSDYAALRGRIARLGLGSQVSFAGFVPDDDLVYLYNAAQALALPSFDEGFGLPAVEAMACGTPVIASERGSLPEVLGDAGLYFDPESVAELAGRLRDVLGDAALRERLGGAGLARSRLFTWEQAARDTVAAFEEVARG